MEEIAKVETQFDFESHKKKAVEQYSKKRPLYDDFTVEIENILRLAIETRRRVVQALVGCRTLRF